MVVVAELEVVEGGGGRCLAEISAEKQMIKHKAKARVVFIIKNFDFTMCSTVARSSYIQK